MACKRFFIVAFLFLLQALPVSAQFVVSSTAAWSSQIVAFWGAIIIAAQVDKVASAATAIFSSIRVTLRTRRIANALSRGNWFLHSGWNNGSTRMDIAVVCWQSEDDLKGMARRIAMQIETFGNNWQVIVLGRQMKESMGAESVVRWVRSPRTERFCGSKVKQTGENLFPLSEQDLLDALDMMGQTPPVTISNIVESMIQRRDTRPSRPIFKTEEHQEQTNSGQISWGYIFTRVHHDQTPYLTLKTWTGHYGTERGCNMLCATGMYTLVHLLISCATGLMAAATGRGLAVWLMTVRPTISTMGGRNVSGNDVLRSLICMDGVSFQYETKDGSRLLAGDTMARPMRLWREAFVLFISSTEILIIIAGWLYGALTAQRLKPSGVVGHGMLWLSVTVALLLSIRALLSLRNRDKGRLVGIWAERGYVRYTIGVESVEIPVSELVLMEDNSPVGLIASILQHSSDEDDMVVVESLMRLPLTTAFIEHLVATKVLKYTYDMDQAIARGEKQVSPKSESPWIQSYCCIVLTMLCSAVSAVYAYYPLPKWVKLVTEILIAVNTAWFNSIDLVGSFMHKRETSVCFMVATLVVSSVWYVGLEGAG